MVCPLRVSNVLAARYLKLAPLNGCGPLQPSAGWQPPFCIRSSSAAPLSNSWLPTALTSRPIRPSDSIVGSSRNRAESSGVAPIKSPAATKMWFGFLARNCATAVARCSLPPAGTSMVLVASAGSLMRMPPRGGLRLPWKSLIASSLTLTGWVARGGVVVQAARAKAVSSRAAVRRMVSDSVVQ